MKERAWSNRSGSSVIGRKKSKSPKQKAIRTSVEYYHVLFEQATDAISITDFEGNFIDVNSSLCEMLGYTKEELLQINVNSLLNQEHLANNPIRFDLLANGENIFNERKMIHKSGRVIFVETNAKKITNSRVMVIGRNITERKKVEQVLQESEANLHAIFDATDTIYVLIDTHFRIISYNPRAIDFVKKEMGYHINSSEYFLDYFPPAKRPVLLNYMTELLGGKNINYEMSYPQPDGLAHWYHVRMFPISKRNTHIYGLMFAVSNITEKKMLEIELLSQKVQEQKNIIRAVLKAQEIERNKIGQELHDNVNQLLACARLSLDSIEREPARLNNLITKTKEHIDLAIAEIRSLSKEQVMPQKTFNLKKLIDELIIEINANSLTATKFQSNVAPDLHMDEDLKINIYRIIQEQINNILKHAAAPVANVEIKLVNKNVFILITDNGRGYNPLVKRNGIGITNMINRIESYNGEVIIDSNPGEGCRIEVRIPI